MYDDDGLVSFELPDFHSRTDRTSHSSAISSSHFALRSRTSSSSTDRPNTTERVVVPSCAHVAEIVGRQGRRIKRLRDLTKTYIRTPSRVETPVFTVTGRSSDVSDAKRQIMLASAGFDRQLKRRDQLDECFPNVASRLKSDPPLTANYGYEPTQVHQSASVQSAETADVTKIYSDNDVISGRSWITHDVTFDHVTSLRRSRDVTFRHSFVKHDVIVDHTTLLKRPRDVTPGRSLVKHDVTEDYLTSLKTSRDVTEDHITSQKTSRHATEDHSVVVIIRVPVPYRSVGLIVGRRGGTIKRIQHDTGTHVVSPDKLQTVPAFIVSGRPEDVERACQRIKQCVWSDKRLTAADADWNKLEVASVDEDYKKLREGTGYSSYRSCRSKEERNSPTNELISLLASCKLN